MGYVQEGNNLVGYFGNSKTVIVDFQNASDPVSRPHFMPPHTPEYKHVDINACHQCPSMRYSETHDDRQTIWSVKQDVFCAQPGFAPHWVLYKTPLTKCDTWYDNDHGYPVHTMRYPTKEEKMKRLTDGLNKAFGFRAQEFQPPESCPYKLEHMMYLDKKKAQWEPHVELPHDPNQCCKEAI